MDFKKLITVSGSQLDNAAKKGISLAESFLDAELLILLDNSGSMETQDAPGRISRRDYAENALQQIQGNNPGKVALICFASTAKYSPGGKIIEVGGSTDLAHALTFAKVADDCGIKILVISDGYPDNETTALNVARQYKQKIDTLYCGSEINDFGGMAFLQKLAGESGGQFFASDAPGMVENEVILLLGGRNV